MHGHNYTVEVIFESDTLTPDSFVRDPLDYRRIEHFIKRTLDRQNMNEIFAAEFEDDLRNAILVKYMGDRTHPGESLINSELELALRTTTENIARALYLRFSSDFPDLVAVKVADNFDTWAEYRRQR